MRKNHLTLIMRLFKSSILTALFIAILFATACKDDPEPEVKPTQTIKALVSSDKYKQSASVTSEVALDSLVKYLTIYPDLAGLLDGATELTFFAPSNAAFINLIATLGGGNPFNLTSINPDVIKGVLAYHIVEGKKLKSALTSGTSINSKYESTNPCNGVKTVEVIIVNSDGTLLTGASNKKIEIGKADILATNGVVHITNSVMVPPSIGDALVPILGKLSAIVLLSKDFTYFATAITKADCGHADANSKIAALLTGLPAATAFIVPNPVFVGTAAAMEISVDSLIKKFTPGQWRDILLNHISSETKNLAALTNLSEVVTMLPNAKLVVTDVPVSENTPKGKILSTVGGSTGMGGTVQAPILIADIPASNGVAHAVGKILFPN